MTLKKIFIYFVITPYILFWIVAPLLDSYFPLLNLLSYKYIGYILLLIPILGSYFLLRLNYKSKENGFFWYFTGVLFFVIGTALLYFLHTFSNFGF